jgi:predicted hydrocarbon binding protein
MTSPAQRLTFDPARGEIRDQARRYLMMRPDVLMGMLRRLDVSLRRAVLDALAASVAAHGKDSVLAYLAHAGDEGLLQAMADAAADLGWGRWRFVQAPDGLELTVENSPFAGGFGYAGHAVCAPIAGMLQAVAEVLFACRATSTERTCAAAGASFCTFRAQRRAGVLAR